MPLGTEVGLSQGHIVLGGNPASLPKKAEQQPPNFRPCLLWPNGWFIKIGLDPGDIVLDGEPGPPKRGTAAPSTFRPMTCLFGQTAGWNSMPRDTEVGLSPGHVVLDGNHTPSSKGAQQPPLFGLCLLWPNGWMHHDTN